MNVELAVELVKATLLQALTLATPILMAALSIGMAISLFQAVTSIQEQTLTFVPKALGIMALLVVLLPWLLRSLVDFTTTIIQKIPQMVQ